MDNRPPTVDDCRDGAIMQLGIGPGCRTAGYLKTVRQDGAQHRPYGNDDNLSQ